MRAFLLQRYDYIRASYWFIPSVMAFLATLLAVGLVWLDTVATPEMLKRIPLVLTSQPDGARTLLGAISGSMIGVAGTVFSVTMAAVVYASGSYGPRLLTNFLNDRGNQLTLGTFIATFVYSILVLRSVRSADETAAAGAFVPNIAVLGGIVLAMCSIGVLIFFIHHVPTNIHISTVIEGIGRMLIDDLDKRFPRKLAEGAEAGDEAVSSQIPPPFRPGDPNATKRADAAGFAELEAGEAGYIQIIDEETLVQTATEHDLVVRLNCRPGTFVHAGRVVFDVYPTERLGEEASDALLSALAIGSRRTAAQDILFLFDELVEIAARALSLGVNDPYTAVNCMDWMGAAMSELAGRQMPNPLRVDEAGRLRVMGKPVSFAEYLDQSFGNLRQYAARDMIAATHFLATLIEIAHSCRTRHELDALREMGGQIVEVSKQELHGASLAAVGEMHSRLTAVLDDPRLRKPPELHLADRAKAARPLRRNPS